MMKKRVGNNFSRNAAPTPPEKSAPPDVGRRRLESQASSLMKTTRTTKKKPTHRKTRWSGRVTRTSHAMDLKPGVFTSDDPKKIAASVKRSAETSHRRKADPYRSALSMITFYANRGGRNLSAHKRAELQQAKQELKRLFHKQ
jgi:hypothetical protein